MSPSQDYDIVLYGATSFVGQITAKYLNTYLPDSDDNDIRWAIAGRSQDKLSKLKSHLSGDVDIIIANSDDSTSLDAMTARTKVVISTVGPYDKYGEPLIKSCVDNGTDYIDLTGEVTWIKRMQDKYTAIAKQNNARIVNCCGFDSIPSDLGVYYTQQQAQEQFGHSCHVIDMQVKAAKGGISGGTIASIVRLIEKASKDAALRKQLMNPYLLVNDSPPQVRQKDANLPTQSKLSGRWTAAFIMANVNTRIVHRSNQLLDYAYGRDFQYSEKMVTGKGVKGQLFAYGMTLGIGGFTLAASIAPIRHVLNNYILPKSGDGPEPQAQDNGYFDLRFYGQTTSGQSIQTKVTGDKDPGYGATAQMLSQSALCLTQDIDDTVEGGFWTPASLLGDNLLSRLKAHTGLKFAVVE